jgi:hypothetical protein
MEERWQCRDPVFVPATPVTVTEYTAPVPRDGAPILKSENVETYAANLAMVSWRSLTVSGLRRL